MASVTERRVLVLLNPDAGRRATAEQARRVIAQHSSLAFDLLVPDPEDQSSQMEHARRALGEGVDAVIVHGGDGMVSAGIGLVADRGIPLGIVPAGTGNDMARAWGIPRRHPLKALQRVLRALERPGGQTTPIDALRVTIRLPGEEPDSRWVGNSVNIGFDALVNREANRLRRLPGSMRYLAALARVIPGFRCVAFRVSLDDQPARTHQSALVCIQNGPFIGGGIPLARGAVVNDGLMEVSLVSRLPRVALVGLFPLLYVRAHRLLGPLRVHQARLVEIQVPPHTPIFADGDPLLADNTDGCAVSVTVHPAAVRLLG